MRVEDNVRIRGDLFAVCKLWKILWKQFLPKKETSSILSNPLNLFSRLCGCESIKKERPAPGWQTAYSSKIIRKPVDELPRWIFASAVPEMRLSVISSRCSAQCSVFVLSFASVKKLVLANLKFQITCSLRETTANSIQWMAAHRIRKHNLQHTPLTRR